KSPEFEGDRFSLAELLSHREQEVMKLLARGMGHKEIEKELHITYDTVKSHRSNILQKLKLENVAQLVKFALDNKIIDRFR
ncbi:MAG: LuxR family two component transcriptional regulator, partial [Bacteroidota bacterium]|nr:LuxR family two component transcriptional regulator [Bacteroidota bacterium]